MFRFDGFFADVLKHKTTRPVSAFRQAFLETKLSEKRGLLISGDSGDFYSVQFFTEFISPKISEEDFSSGKICFGILKIFKKFVIPFERIILKTIVLEAFETSVKCFSPPSVSRSATNQPSRKQVRRFPPAHGHSGIFSKIHLFCLRKNKHRFPNLFFPYQFAVISAYFITKTGSSAVLPDDCITDRYAGFLVPDNCRFSLICYSGGGNIACR